MWVCGQVSGTCEEVESRYLVLRVGVVFLDPEVEHIAGVRHGVGPGLALLGRLGLKDEVVREGARQNAPDTCGNDHRGKFCV